MAIIALRPPAGLLFCLTTTALLAACTPPAVCARGQPVTIPAADATSPAVTVDFRGRGGALTQITAGAPGPFRIPMPAGPVTVDAVAQDPEGIRKVVIVVQPRTCTTSRATGQTTCTVAPAQTFTNEDTGAAGAVGCTARLVSAGVTVARTLTTAKDSVEESANVLVFGQNFGGRNTNTGWKEVGPLP
jgi:hypothetical protein